MARKKYKPGSLAVRALYFDGKFRGLWSGIDELGGILQMPSGTLSGYLSGHSAADEIVASVAQKMQAAFDERRDIAPLKIHPLMQKARDLFLDGMRQGKWTLPQECAGVIGVEKNGMSKYLYKAPDILRSPRSITYVEKMNELMQAEMKKPPARRDDPTPKPPAQDHLDNGDGKRDPPRPFGNTDENVQPGVIASPWFDRILAGVADCTDQNLNGIRFVLRAGNFRKYHGPVTRQEVDDTVRLIEELRRRFNLFTQLDDEATRLYAAKTLQPQIDELYVAIEGGKEVLPTGAAEEMHNIRTALQRAHGKRC